MCNSIMFLFTWNKHIGNPIENKNYITKRRKKLRMEKCCRFVVAFGNYRGKTCAHGQLTLIAQLGKNPPAMLETWVWSLGWEDPLEKGKAIHSSIQSMGLQTVGHDWATFTSLHGHLISPSLQGWMERNTCPQQCPWVGPGKEFKTE